MSKIQVKKAKVDNTKGVRFFFSSKLEGKSIKAHLKNYPKNVKLESKVGLSRPFIVIYNLSAY